MVEIRKSNKHKFDFSIIPSLECNLECPFCMYNSGPSMLQELDIIKTKKFLDTVDWTMINSFGFYGGEPSINLPLYQNFMDLIPSDIPKFIITNGSWSNEVINCLQFLNFAHKNKLHVVISGTSYHKLFQNKELLKDFKELCTDAFTLKGGDTIIPMGRASKENWECTNKCVRYDCATRVGLFPGGSIVFQNCDGVYPHVQTYEEPFNVITLNIEKTINKCKGWDKKWDIK
jgi:hypothetical protein